MSAGGEGTTGDNTGASPAGRPASWQARLPFFYGWVVIGVAFVTMAIAVTARTSFSLLLPPLIDEFGWERGLSAGAFSFGFLVSAALSPLVGRLMDRRGPLVVIESGVGLVTSGLLLSVLIAEPWQLYLTLGLAVGCGANLMTFTAHSQFLPNWFLRRRGLAISLAFSGVGVGAIVLLPWLQNIVLAEGWRAACIAMAALVAMVLGPLNLLVRRRPEDLGLLPDGDSRTEAAAAARGPSRVVDRDWAAVEWTLGRALATARFWWIVGGFFCALVAWYAVQVHQTKYLIEIGFDAVTAAWGLGVVSAVAIPGQIALGALSDRIGREWVWSAGCLGFAICYGALILLESAPSPALLWAMVLSQGALGYALTSVMGAIVVEIFEGPHFGTIFGTVMMWAIAGGALGPWLAGAIHDATGSYRPAFLGAIVCCAFSAAAIWIAGPGRIRLVPGKLGRGR
ncbi:MAG: MFS transporter [Alphaproteobacteria bacterium]|nr:MFS transporter [Alphaproteobacteria bacterium]